MVDAARLVLLLTLVVVAAVTDVRWHKIYNWNVYPGIVAGFVVNGLKFSLEDKGLGAGLLFSLEGFLACGLIMLACFVFFDVGGGDVKLIAMMGAFLGLRDGIEAMLWTFVLGSVVGAIILIWQIGFWRIVRKAIHHLLLVVRSGSWVPLTREEREPLRRWLFLAPSGLAGILIVAGRDLID